MRAFLSFTLLTVVSAMGDHSGPGIALAMIAVIAIIMFAIAVIAVVAVRHESVSNCVIEKGRIGFGNVIGADNSAAIIDPLHGLTYCARDLDSCHVSILVSKEALWEVVSKFD
jgi:hypothetical protein